MVIFDMKIKIGIPEGERACEGTEFFFLYGGSREGFWCYTDDAGEIVGDIETRDAYLVLMAQRAGFPVSKVEAKGEGVDRYSAVCVFSFSHEAYSILKTAFDSRYDGGERVRKAKEALDRNSSNIDNSQ